MLSQLRKSTAPFHSSKNSIYSGGFYEWSNNNMYRTSYHDMSNKVF